MLGGTLEKSIIHANDCYLPYFANASSLMTSSSRFDWDSQVLIEMTDSRTGPSKVSGQQGMRALDGFVRVPPSINTSLFTSRTDA